LSLGHFKKTAKTEKRKLNISAYLESESETEPITKVLA